MSVIEELSKKKKRSIVEPACINSSMHLIISDDACG
jgi:hypothetical protein